MCQNSLSSKKKGMVINRLLNRDLLAKIKIERKNHPIFRIMRLH